MIHITMTPGKVVFLVNLVLLAALWAGDHWASQETEDVGYAVFAVAVFVFLAMLDTLTLIYYVASWYLA